ncbi:macrophage immunometabolism regulator isoform X1 [Cyclopterus lumpus]|uniref:macrophage immunometabolism regulator isoform X1 n=1 Tax=Cyclopterus lumpus TaxID=8103 RepID=UPI001485D3F1|nr:macrophage immunometabolism regulator isoform X1 [Cyclopterus lumpus]
MLTHFLFSFLLLRDPGFHKHECDNHGPEVLLLLLLREHRREDAEAEPSQTEDDTSDPPLSHSRDMSVRMEMDINGVSLAHVSILPPSETKATLKPEAERPRCASTPCSPIRGYQILHMDSNYLVGFTTGEELLKLAHKWSEGTPEKGSVSEAMTSSAESPVPKSVDLGIHRSSRICKGKNRHYQPYDIPAANGRRRRRMPSSSDTFLREPGRGLHAPLPLCLLKGKRAQSKSLDYLNLDKISIKESSDTEVLQYQLQHLTLRGERLFTRNKT